MKMKVYAGVVILMLIVFGTGEMRAQVTDCSSRLSKGEWSNNAVDISPQGPSGTQYLRICSPDKQKAVVLNGDSWWVEAGKKRLSKPVTLNFHSEIQWAPNSDAFYVTGSDGETTGSQTDIYIVRNRSLATIRTTQMVAKDFDKQHRCWDDRFGVGNEPNVGGLLWADAEELLLVAEVPNVGICKEMKYFGGYLISVPSGKIKERLSPQEITDRWGDTTGERLQSDFKSLSAQQKTAVP